MELATDIIDVFETIKRLNADLTRNPKSELVKHLSHAHGFYVVYDETNEPLFGFTKFVGYKGMNSRIYLDNYKQFSGGGSKKRLERWFKPLENGSDEYRDLFGSLTKWMSKFSKRPRMGSQQPVKILVLKSKRQNASGC